MGEKSFCVGKMPPQKKSAAREESCAGADFF